MLRLSGLAPLLTLLPEPGLSHLALLWESTELSLHTALHYFVCSSCKCKDTHGLDGCGTHALPLMYGRVGVGCQKRWEG